MIPERKPFHIAGSKHAQSLADLAAESDRYRAMLERKAAVMRRVALLLEDGERTLAVLEPVLDVLADAEGIDRHDW